MTAKELNKAIDSFFSENKSKDCLTYESLIELFEKQPTTRAMLEKSNCLTAANYEFMQYTKK